jgi:hypothetical protein
MISATEGWAVGSRTVRGVPLAEHWDGTAWSSSKLPPLPAKSPWGSLYGVSELSPTDVWAVGSAGGPLIYHFDGTSWSSMPPPDVGPDGGTLDAVLAIASDDVWAAGDRWISSPSASSESLLLHFDGSSWSVSTHPIQSDGWVSGLAATSSSDVWASAVGDDPTGSQNVAMLHFDGSAWSQIAAATTVAQGYPDAVAANGSDAWMVGWLAKGRRSHPLAERWQGASWARVNVPMPAGAISEEVAGVSFGSGGNAWAAGISWGKPVSGVASGTARILHWDGSAWNYVTTPTPGTSSGVWGLSVAPDGSGAAVGGYETRSGSLGSLILMACGL